VARVGVCDAGTVWVKCPKCARLIWLRNTLGIEPDTGEEVYYVGLPLALHVRRCRQ
jgi:hypothetical protein